ncbi:SCO family protein [Ulvibacter litoralis]|uniref:Protein SCO1/2 n=1 Tax=Ulvibacter litoralis TaxID=227084 RepID=A0A1G7DVG2_9FLAO|nr:SCO family protein [Ulvibacter litoralis]GHC42099.1 photosynthetic protein synthase II [Ulvibacter litoralis]SDE55479.1 protein SCO1/2 [Ulvibacter litoralis]
MKKNTYIGISFIVLVFGIIFIPKILNRLENGSVVDADRMSNNEHNFEATEAIDKAKLLTISEVPPFKFVNQNNDTITNADYAGKVYVVEFFFSTCQSICPIMNTNMIKVQDAFKDTDDFGIASFTIDPAYDTPEVLKEYAEAYGVHHKNWNFLTGDKDAIFKLSNEGFKLYAGVTDDPEESFEHSGLFALIDQEGNVRSRIDEFGNPVIYYNGLEDDGVNMLIEDIKKLL